MGAEYKVHTKLLTEFETLGVMGENCSGIIILETRSEYNEIARVLCVLIY